MKSDLGVGFKSAQITRRASWAAKAREMARPRPDEEPETTHTLFLERSPVVKVDVAKKVLEHLRCLEIGSVLGVSIGSLWNGG